MTVLIQKESGETYDYKVTDLDIDLGTRWPYREYD